MSLNPSLPDPDPSALERSGLLTERVRDAIRATPQAVLGFDDYMAIVLYTPDLGYYAGDNAIFGAGGDFVTAPESGELFGNCLATQCADILRATGGDLVEYCAGSGALAATLLEVLATQEDLPAFRYHIVEPSAVLRERQRQRLTEQLGSAVARVEWHHEHLPPHFSGVVIANEVLDAMPARRYVVLEDRVSELGVALEAEQLVWRAFKQRRVPAQIEHAIKDFAPGYCCEQIAACDSWLKTLAGRLDSGVVLLADYGYPRHEFLHPSRRDGTLKCHYQQQVHDDPFFLPGLQDLTTAVNFSDVAEAAAAAGLNVAGFTTQTKFLLGCGLEQHLGRAGGADVARVYTLGQEAKRLLLPGEMGQTCKFLALSKACPGALRGFRDDEAHRLAGLSMDAGL